MFPNAGEAASWGVVVSGAAQLALVAAAARRRGLLETLAWPRLSADVRQFFRALFPAIIGWHAISFWQAVGILLLSKILFGGFRGRGGMSWRHRMGERWERMSPEEREKFGRAAVGIASELREDGIEIATQRGSSAFGPEEFQHGP